MDAKDKHELRERRREEALARRVGEALDQMNPSGADECPDAEILAAYAERALTQGETVHWESHFATCARCRKILRVLAASSDTPLAESEVARLGELVAGARVPSRTAEPLRIARPRAWDWRVRWLAPALGAAAVLALWLAVRTPWRNGDQGASATLVAQAPKLTPSVSGPTDQRSRNLALEDKEAFRKQASRPNAGNQALYSRSGNAVTGSAPATNELRSAAPKQETDDNALQKQKKDALDALTSRRPARLDPTAPAPPTAPPPAKTETATGAAAASPQSDVKAPVLSSQNAAPSPPPPPPPAPRAKALMETPAASAPLPQAQAKSGVVSPQVSEQPGSTNQTVTVTEAAPVVETANGTLGGTLEPTTPADLPLNGRDYAPLILLSPAPKSAVSFRAPSGSILWRTASGGKIERSNDSGRNWQAQTSPSQENWLAGVAVSDIVCWLAGRNGAIARSEDGDHWSLVSPPSQAAGSAGKLPDWTGITARDALSATVTAGDGRRFATVDGGKTWQAQQ